jgi:hypothetical protein
MSPEEELYLVIIIAIIIIFILTMINTSYQHMALMNRIINDPNIINRVRVVNVNDMVKPRTIRSAKPREKSKAITNKKLKESCPTECAICQETPKHEDAVRTKCNHYYCKKCWEGWMDAPASNKSCPTCRNDKPQATSFRARAARKQKPKNFEYHDIYRV